MRERLRLFVLHAAVLFAVAAPGFASGPDETPLDEGVRTVTRGADGALRLEVLDLRFAAEEPSLRGEFEGQRIVVTGQCDLTECGPGGFRLVRTVIVCCADDAKRIGLRVAGRPPEGTAQLGWVRVSGVARFEEKDGEVEPWIEVEKVEAAEEPAEGVRD